MSIPNPEKLNESEAEALQLAKGAIVTLAIKAYIAEKKMFPDSLATVEKWLGQKLPEDVFLDNAAPMHFVPKGSRKLFSVGPDMKANTSDDIVFMPLQ